LFKLKIGIHRARVGVSTGRKEKTILRAHTVAVHLEAGDHSTEWNAQPNR